jgi:hypothetical protein
MSAHPVPTKYKPSHPEKYRGTVDNIVCRSSWERTVCQFLDLSPAVMEWSSEEFVIPYINPLDGRPHRYFPDFLVKVKNREGGTRIIMIEVKPAAQTRAPVKPTRKTRRYLREMATYAVNSSKWEAAKGFCDSQGWEFLILTEAMARL